jgi:uncharacterized protein YbjT (DUF2867 family)
LRTIRAVAKLLVERGHRVRALTREPESVAASTLEEHGVIEEQSAVIDQW